MIKDVFSLAFKNLKSRGVRSWLTLLGIFVGVTAVVSLISIGNGLELAVASQFGIEESQLITVRAGGLNGFGPPGSADVDPLMQSDVDAIARLSSVDKAIRINLGSVKVEYNDHVQFKFAASVPNTREGLKILMTQWGADPIQGRLLEEGETGKVALGYNYYGNDEDWGGKAITVGKTILINDQAFEVVGIMDKKGSLIVDNIIHMPAKDLEELFDVGDEVDAILVEPKDKNNIDKTVEDIENLLRKRRDVDKGEENFEVSTPESSLATINSVLNGVQIFIIIIASISIFIGAVGIVNTMTTSVIERKKEIGIMKSVGATNEQIFSQFFVESSLLGLSGGLIGAIFGTLIGAVSVSGLNTFLGTDLTPNIDFILIFLALAGSFLIGGISGIVPAMKAARQNPVEALRD